MMEKAIENNGNISLLRNFWFYTDLYKQLSVWNNYGLPFAQSDLAEEEISAKSLVPCLLITFSPIKNVRTRKLKQLNLISVTTVPTSVTGQ